MILYEKLPNHIKATTHYTELKELQLMLYFNFEMLHDNVCI